MYGYTVITVYTGTRPGYTITYPGAELRTVPQGTKIPGFSEPGCDASG